MPVSPIADSAQTLQPGNPVSGTLPTWDDRNYVAISVQAGLSYALTLTPENSLLHFALVDSSGADATHSVQRYGSWSPSLYVGPNTIDSTASTSLPGGPAIYTFSAVSTDILYAEIDGSYSGVVLLGAPIPPARYAIQLGAPDDHGDTPATAGQLTVGSSVTGSFDVQNDVDAFAIVLQAGTTYEFDDTSDNLFEMSLSSPDQNLAHWSPFYPALTYTPNETGTYYLSVSTRAGDGLGQYTISAKALLTIPSTDQAGQSQPVQSQPVQPKSAEPDPAPVSIAIHRLFDPNNGAQFLTADANELSALRAARPDMVDEGVGLHAVGGNQPNATAVFRFFDTSNGSHFLTADTAERDTLLVTRPDLTFEGAGFYEYGAPYSNAAPVYRYFDTSNGTHLFTSSASEIASIAATRPDLRSEGIAFYAPTQIG